MLDRLDLQDEILLDDNVHTIHAVNLDTFVYQWQRDLAVIGNSRFVKIAA